MDVLIPTDAKNLENTRLDEVMSAFVFKEPDEVGM